MQKDSQTSVFLCSFVVKYETELKCRGSDNMTVQHDDEPKKQSIRLKPELSVLDWLFIYTGTIVLVNLLIGTQLYPSRWMASLLPGGANDVNLLFIHEILQCALIAGGVMLFLHLRQKNMQSIGWKEPEDAQDYIRAVIFGVVTCSFMLVVSGVLTQIFPQWASTQNVVETTLQVDTRWGLLVSFLSVGVMAPLCEELLFRGYLYHAVRVKFGKWASVIITSFLFAIVHGQWFQMVPLFMAGVFLNWFYLRSESLIATVLMHSAWNTFSLFLVVYLNIYV